MDNRTHEKRPCVHPSDEMVAWIKLAATHQRAGLGNSITAQTEQALQEMVTFLTQPAQVYALADPEDGATDEPAKTGVVLVYVAYAYWCDDVETIGVFSTLTAAQAACGSPHPWHRGDLGSSTWWSSAGRRRYESYQVDAVHLDQIDHPRYLKDERPHRPPPITPIPQGQVRRG